MIKDYNVTIAYENGNFSHTENFKAESKSDVLTKVATDYWKEADNIVTITILEKVPYKEPDID